MNRGFQYGYPTNRVKRDLDLINKTKYGCWEKINRTVAFVCFVLLLPMFALVWVLHKVFIRGSFIFKQERPGYKGKRFTIYKIRTMKVGAEKATALGTSDNGAYVPLFGKILRKLKIDELPQLWNIVQGDMALVGPRPIPIALNDELSSKIEGFDERYNVKPGLSSMGQICVNDNALEEELINDWKIRFEGELHYIRNQSVSYDIVIISMTTIFVIKKLWKLIAR